MPRPAKFDEDKILAAAATLVANNGPAAATMTAIKHALGASSGSIYHRFKTRDELLGRLWLSRAEAFENRWMAALEQPDPVRAGLEAALSMPKQARLDFDGARAMLLHRREDFFMPNWPPDMKAESEYRARQLKNGLAAMTKRLFERDTAAARRATAFATIDMPFSALRPYIREGSFPPPHVDALIERAYMAVIEVERGAQP